MTWPRIEPARFQAALEASCLALQGVICRRCLEACAAGALALAPLCGGYARPLVDPALCVGCGRCLGVCPAARGAER